LLFVVKKMNLNDLMVDAIDLEKDLTCPVCFEFYNDTVKRPCNLDCGHVLCKECTQKILQGIGQRKCPLDNRQLPNIHIDEMPLNYTLMSIVETVKQSKVRNNASNGSKSSNSQQKAARFAKLNELLLLKKRELIVYTEKLLNHIHSCVCTIDFAQDLYDGYQVGCKVKTDDLKRLKVFIDAKKMAHLEYENVFHLIKKHLIRVDALVNDLESLQKTDGSDDAFDALEEHLKALSLSKKDKDVAERPIEGQGFLNEFQELIDYESKEIEKSQDLLDVIGYIKTKGQKVLEVAAQNTQIHSSKLKIGIIGNSGKKEN
jgi:hypothetical protein